MYKYKKYIQIQNTNQKTKYRYRYKYKIQIQISWMSSLTLATGSCCKSQTTDVGGDKEWSRQNKLSTLRRTHPCSLASMRNTNTDNNTYTNTDKAQRRTHPRSLACFDEKYSGRPNTNTDNNTKAKQTVNPCALAPSLQWGEEWKANVGGGGEWKYEKQYKKLNYWNKVDGIARIKLECFYAIKHFSRHQVLSSLDQLSMLGQQRPILNCT